MSEGGDNSPLERTAPGVRFNEDGFNLIEIPRVDVDLNTVQADQLAAYENAVEEQQRQRHEQQREQQGEEQQAKQQTRGRARREGGGWLCSKRFDARITRPPGQALLGHAANLQPAQTGCPGTTAVESQKN